MRHNVNGREAPLLLHDDRAGLQGVLVRADARGAEEEGDDRLFQGIAERLDHHLQPLGIRFSDIQRFAAANDAGNQPDWRLLEKLLRQQRSLWYHVQWLTLNSWFERLCCFLLLPSRALLPAPPAERADFDRRRCRQCRDWMLIRGRSIPIQSDRYLQGVYSILFFRHGFEWFLKHFLHAVLICQFGYEIVRQHRIGFELVCDVYEHSEINVMRNFIYRSFGLQSGLVRLLMFALPVTPLLYGMIWGLLKARSHLRDYGGGGQEGRQEQLLAWFGQRRSFLLQLYQSVRNCRPTDDTISQCLAHMVRWDGRMAPGVKTQIVRALTNALGRAWIYKHYKLTQRLAKLVHSIHYKDLIRLRGQVPSFDMVGHLYSVLIARQALDTMYRRPLQGRGFLGWLKKQIVFYWLWAAGCTPFECRNLLLKASFVTYQVAIHLTYFSLLHSLVQAIEEYYSCPDKKGLTLTGFADWSSDYSQSCFFEYIKLFRSIPGQPIQTLTEQIHQFHFGSSFIGLDLSNKQLSGAEISWILSNLTAVGVHVDNLTLSHNMLSDPKDYELFMPELYSGLTALDLSSVKMEDQGLVAATQAMAQGLVRLKQLKILQLQNNRLGISSDAGVVMLMDSVASLTQLESLDLRDNSIGFSSDVAVRHLAASLRNLRRLSLLNIDHNYIGRCGSDGVEELANALIRLPLTGLDLGYNFIGSTGLAGALALAEAVGDLRMLRHLSLGGGYFEEHGKNGSLAIAASVGNLTELRTLMMAFMFGRHGTDSLSLFSQSLKNMPKLESLSFAGSLMGSTGVAGVRAFGDSLKSLPRLTYLDLSDVSALEKCGTGGSESLGEGLGYLHELKTLCLSKTKLGSKGSYGVQAIGNSLASMRSLTDLDLSYNEIGKTDDQGTEALGRGLAKSSSLVSLDLSINKIGSTSLNGSTVLLEGIGSMKGLKYLSLQGALLPIAQVEVLNQHLQLLGIAKLPLDLLSVEDVQLLLGQLTEYSSELSVNIQISEVLQRLLEQLPQVAPNVSTLKLSGQFNGFSSEAYEALAGCHALTSLDLSGVQLSTLLDDNTTWTLIDNISKLKGLVTLNLAGIPLEKQTSNVTCRLATGLTRLTSLTALDLSNAFIGAHDTLGTSCLGRAFSRMEGLESLFLRDNHLGFHGNDGVQALAAGLQVNLRLASLDLTGCSYLGDKDSGDMLALAKALGHLPSLHMLKLANTGIGVSNSLGSEYLSQSFQNLSQLVWLDLGGCYIGRQDDRGMLALAGNLSYLQSLQVANFTQLRFGQYGSKATVALSDSLKRLPEIKTVDLRDNLIGLRGGLGTRALLSFIQDRPDLIEVDLHGNPFVNNSNAWTLRAELRSEEFEVQLQHACQAQLCFSQPLRPGPVNTTQVNFIASSRSSFKGWYYFSFLSCLRPVAVIAVVLIVATIVIDLFYRFSGRFSRIQFRGQPLLPRRSQAVRHGDAVAAVEYGGGTPLTPLASVSL